MRYEIAVVDHIEEGRYCKLTISNEKEKTDRDCL